MADPTPKVRAAVYARDLQRCLACGATSPLTFQHRQAVGMGGTKHRPSVYGGITACAVCNGRFEHDMQALALAYGWKVPRWLPPGALWDVPVYDAPQGRWYLLSLAATRIPITPADAHELMVWAYGVPKYTDMRRAAHLG